MGAVVFMVSSIAVIRVAVFSRWCRRCCLLVCLKAYRTHTHLLLFPSPFILLASHFFSISFLRSRNSEPGSHDRLFPLLPPVHYGSCLGRHFLSREDFEALPSLVGSHRLTVDSTKHAPHFAPILIQRASVRKGGRRGCAGPSGGPHIGGSRRGSEGGGGRGVVESVDGVPGVRCLAPGAAARSLRARTGRDAKICLGEFFLFVSTWYVFLCFFCQFRVLVFL